MASRRRRRTNEQQGSRTRRRSNRTNTAITFQKKRFFGLTPLQFLCFGEVPLLFAYSERYHYNSCFVTATPWSTYPMDSGPAAGVYPRPFSRMAHFAPGSRGKGRRPPLSSAADRYRRPPLSFPFPSPLCSPNPS